jgi:galactofuranosylgalactofuranosylrhamnosyl-N-acetylglucosaminyl-diphospho-decaprenol beta-1,5/1,6-galactofuranosyltransferase
MDIGRARTLRIPLWFAARAFIRLHYETLSALNLSFEDVLRGPAFFAENADMARRRADLKALMQDEAWQPVSGPLPVEKRRFNPQRRSHRALMKLTLNGHLLPFFRLYGNRLVLDANERTNPRLAWGAAQITFLDADRLRSYTLTHSKRRGWRELTRLARNSWRFWRDYDRLKAEWRQGYGELASEAFWTRTLKLPEEG